MITHGSLKGRKHPGRVRSTIVFEVPFLLNIYRYDSTRACRVFLNTYVKQNNTITVIQAIKIAKKNVFKVRVALITICLRAVRRFLDPFDPQLAKRRLIFLLMRRPISLMKYIYF